MRSIQFERVTSAIDVSVAPPSGKRNVRKCSARTLVFLMGCLLSTGLATSAAVAQKTAAQYRAEAAALEAEAEHLLQAPKAPAQPPAPPLGRQVQGYVFGNWETCTTVGPKGRFGGQILHCPSLLADGIFSETDVREIGAGAEAAQPTPQPGLTPPAAPAQPPAPPLGRQVQGYVFGNWEICTTVGPKGRFGGQILHCPSLLADGIFSETDVREIGAGAEAAQPTPQPGFTPPAAPAQPPLGRQVQGRVFGNWETCRMIGKQLESGGYLLHCPSLPDDNIFSEAEVRL
jgi:hypothetical protein